MLDLMDLMVQTEIKVKKERLGEQDQPEVQDQLVIKVRRDKLVQMDLQVLLEVPVLQDRLVQQDLKVRKDKRDYKVILVGNHLNMPLAQRQQMQIPELVI